MIPRLRPNSSLIKCIASREAIFIGLGIFNHVPKLIVAPFALRRKLSTEQTFPHPTPIPLVDSHTLLSTITQAIPSSSSPEQFQHLHDSLHQFISLLNIPQRHPSSPFPPSRCSSRVNTTNDSSLSYWCERLYSSRTTIHR